MRKIFCVSGAVLAMATPAWSQVNPATANAFAQCGGIADPASRLACYDAAQPPRVPAAAPASKPSGPARYPEFNASPQTQMSAPPPNTAFGSSAIARGKLVAAVTSYSLSPSGRFTIVLDNGQIWKQVDSDDGVAQFRKEGRNMVAISKGFLWSYDLKLNAMSAVFKVTRVK